MPNPFRTIWLVEIRFCAKLKSFLIIAKIPPNEPLEALDCKNKLLQEWTPVTHRLGRMGRRLGKKETILEFYRIERNS
jgi:hypothetical protein